MPLTTLVIAAALLAQPPFTSSHGQARAFKRTQQASPAPTQSVLSALIDPAGMSGHGLMVLAPPRDFSADWFARRCGVTGPSLESTRLGTPANSVDVYALRPHSASDAGRLWSVLESDLAPNQALVEKRGVIGLVISPDAGLLRKVIDLIKATRQAPVRSDLDWLPSEMPREIAGLAYVYAKFLTPLPQFEARVNGLSLRAVYQASYALSRTAGLRGLAQADFWVPREPTQVRQLVRALDERKTPEQTIMSGKGAAVLVSTRTDEATQILVDLLQQKGYRLESRKATFK